MQKRAVKRLMRCWDRPRWSRTLAVGASLAIALAAAGCGSSSSTGTSASGSKTSARAATSTGTVDVEYISDLSGTNHQEAPFLAAMKAAVAAANVRGGVRGHKIVLTVCDSQVSDQADAACGQKAVSDHAIAVIGNDHEDAALPYLQQAHIPDLNVGLSPGDASNPDSFMINDGSIALFGGLAPILKDDGCKSFAALDEAFNVSPPSAAAFTATIAAAAKQFGITYDGQIVPPTDAPAMAPYVTQLTDKDIDCAVLQADGPPELSALQALLPETQIRRIAIPVSLLTEPGDVKTLGPIIKKFGSRITVLIASEGPGDLSNTAVKQWVNDESKYGPKPPDFSTNSALQWASLQLIIKAGDAVSPDLTASRLVSYLDSLSNYAPGVVPPLSFDKKVANADGPRVFAAWAAGSTWTNGSVFDRVGPFVNVITGATNTNQGG